MREHRLVSLGIAISALVACSDQVPSTASASGAGGTGGVNASAGSGGAAGSMATVAGGDSGASGATSAGMPAAGGGGVGGAAGSGGSGGNGGAAGGGGQSLTEVASALHQIRLECPCIDAEHFGLEKTDNCDATPQVDRQTYVKTLGGDAGTTYDVKLHVRGNTEPNTYVGGTLEQDRFYIGGETSTPGYTAYMLTVAEPPQVYFFNYHPSTSHIHFLIDYEVVIPMQGGTTATFEVNGGKSVPDGHGVSNREELVVPGIAPAPEPFNGQLVQFDVVSVEARP